MSGVGIIKVDQMNQSVCKKAFDTHIIITIITYSCTRNRIVAIIAEFVANSLVSEVDRQTYM